MEDQFSEIERQRCKHQRLRCFECLDAEKKELEAKVESAKLFRTMVTEWADENEWSNADIKQLMELVKITKTKDKG